MYYNNENIMYTNLLLAVFSIFILEKSVPASIMSVRTLLNLGPPVYTVIDIQYYC